MGSTRFRIPPALSSVLAALGTLQLRAGGILNRVDPLVSASNLYIYRENVALKSQVWGSLTLAQLGEESTKVQHGLPLCVSKYVTVHAKTNHKLANLIWRYGAK